MVKTGRKKLYFICAAFCLLSCIFCGCGQAKDTTGNQANPAGNQANSAENQTNPSGTGEATQAPDWMAAFKPVNGGQTASGGQSANDGQEAKTIEEQIEEIAAKMGYPTAAPPREFIPAEGQVELVLWAGSPDEYIVAELNHILQERGCSFYLTVTQPPEPEDPYEHNDVVDDVWRDFFDEGKAVDLISVGNGWQEFWKKYGKTGIERMITEGCLLPFSEYPDTPAKDSLRAAYPEEYWRMCSFGGENYGISKYMLQLAPGKKYLLFNLELAEQAGIEVPEELDLLHLDEMLEKAEAAGIPGIGTEITMIDYYGVELLPCGLFVKYLPDGGYSFVNPFEDGELLELMEAMNRYMENEWVTNDIMGKPPLVLYASAAGDLCYLEGDRFVVQWFGMKEGRSTRIKVYGEENLFLQEASLLGILGISSASRHKEEALELLCLMHTDEEIVRLLRYGVEGVHYRLGKDGLEKVKTTGVNVKNIDGVDKVVGYGVKTWESPGVNTIGNPRMPLELDGLFGIRHRDDAGYYGETEGVCRIPSPGDLLAGKEDELEKIRDILYIGSKKEGYSLYSIEGLWQKRKKDCKKGEDYKQELEEMRAALAEAEYNELIAELNQRLGARE